MGYAEIGLPAERADTALLRAVELARPRQGTFPAAVLIAASLGPYGAALHNGAEYHGNYDCTHDELVQFHRERIAVLAAGPPDSAPDLLAFETLPSLEEAMPLAKRWLPGRILPPGSALPAAMDNTSRTANASLTAHVRWLLCRRRQPSG